MLDRKGDLRRRVAKGEAVGVFWFATGSPALVEVAVETPCDAVVLDAQHGLWDRRSLEQAVGCVGRDRPVLIRTADAAPAGIGAALDTGAEGVLVPMVESAAQAAAIVSAARFPPQGSRSAGGVRPLGRGLGEHMAQAAERTLVGVMIETPEGARNAAAIAATPGVDLVFIGSGDLSLALAGNPATTPEDSFEAIRAACAEAGTPCGIYTGDAAAAVAARDKGFTFVVAANDLGVITAGFAGAADTWTG